MQHPRHPLKPEAQRIIEERQAYFSPEKAPAQAPVVDLSPLEQMFAYYDAA